MSEQVGQWRKTSQGGLLITTCQRLEKKDSDRAIIAIAETVYVPANLEPPGCNASSCTAFMFNPHWGRTHRHKKSWVYTRGSLHLCPTLCSPVDCGLPGFLLGGSPGMNAGAVAIPFQSTIVPAVLVSNPPEYLVLPEPLRPKQLHRLHNCPSHGQAQALQSSLRSKPQWTTHMQSWK